MERRVGGTCDVVLALVVGRGVAGAGAATDACTPPAPDLAVLSTLKWRNVGPARGGRSITAVGQRWRARWSTTSARPAAACGRPPTAA